MSNVLHVRPRAIGGQLFFWYLAMCKIPVLRETLRETEACTQNVPFELEEALVEREDMFFYGFILTSCRVSGENRQSL